MAMAGGFRVWAERLRQAEAATRREGLALAAQAGGPLSYPRRLAGSGEALGGSFADHLVNVILSLERDHLDPLADRLVRVSGGLGQLAD
ncbi:MAG TPA: hypothetical protein VGL92_05135, partial [Acidimicrobiia bacterium]